jgi:hypothetical protein
MNSNQIMVKMVLDRWNGQIKQFTTALEAYSDEQLQKEIAPGRNRGIYLLGHLIAVHDDMMPLLNLGSKTYPEFNKLFIEESDNKNAKMPSATELRTIWKKQCEEMSKKFSALQPEQWFERHTNISAEDFVNEPHRNRLNVVIGRISHLAYHTGQFILIK